MNSKYITDCNCFTNPCENAFNTCYGAVEIINSSGTAIVPVETRALLPSIGNSSVGYYIRDEESLYVWDNKNLKYIPIGRNYENIKIINGGDANEFENSEV